MNGGVFNFFGNLSTSTTPIVIGYMVQKTGSYNGALIFVGAAALMAIFSYVVIVGDIKRLELHPAVEKAAR
jgi:ACS family glucarate transporter-like MFS transporter